MWKLVGSLVGYYGLFRLGVGAGIMRFLPLYEGRNDRDRACGIVSTAVVVFAVVGLFIFAVSFYFADAISAFFDGGPELAYLVRVFGGVAGLECPTRVFDTVIRAREKWFLANIVSMMFAVARALGLVCCAVLGYGLIAMSFTVLGTTFLASCGTIALYAITCRGLRISLWKVKFLHIRVLLGFGIFSLITALFWSYSLQAHSIIVAKMMSLEAVGVYAVAMVLMSNIRRLNKAPNRVLWPRFAFLDGASDKKGVADVFVKATGYNAILSSAVIVMLVGVGPVFVRLWVGEGFEEIYPVLYIFAAGYFADGLLAAIPPVIGGLGKLKTLALWAFLEGVFGITGSILLTPVLGLRGVALGYTVAVLIVRGCMSIPYICRLTGLTVRQFIVNSLWRPSAIVGCCIVVFSVFPLVEFIHTWLAFVVACCGLGAVYGCVGYFFLLDEEQQAGVIACGKRLRTYALAGRCER